MAKIKIASGNGWVFNENTQRLEKWVAEKCKFTLGSSIVEYHGTLGGKPYEIKADVNDELRVFDSPEDFKDGQAAHGVFENVCDMYNFKRYVPVVINKDDEGNNTYYAYTFKDGQAVYTNVKGMACEYDFKSNEFKSETKCYASEKSVYEYNDFQILNEDGTTTIKKSLKTRLAFNDEQKALIDELGGLLDKLKGSGVLVVYDRETETLCAFKDIVRFTNSDELKDDDVCVTHMAHDIRSMTTIDDYWGAVIMKDE